MSSSATHQMDDLPKVLIATAFEIPHTGGASTHIEALIDQLRQANRYGGIVEGGQVAPTKFARGVVFASRLFNREAYTIALHDKIIAGLKNRIAAALRSDREIGIIHAHDHRAAIAAREAIQAAGTKSVRVVQTVHGPWLYEVQQIGVAADGTPLGDYIAGRESQSLQCADRIIAVDTGQRELALKFGAAAEKMTVIFNAVVLDEIDAHKNDKTDRCPPSPFFVVPRRLVPKTGVRFAIEAIAAIPAAERPHLLVAGQGPQHEELKQLVVKLGLTDRVQLPGPVPRHELIAVMARSNGVIVPSVPAAGVVEATSLSAIEAMALEVPSIASAIGGLAEIINDGVTGLLVPPGDAKALADAMRRAMNPDTVTRLGKAGRQFVEDRLSMRPWFESVLKVYRATCSAGAAA